MKRRKRARKTRGTSGAAMALAVSVLVIAFLTAAIAKRACNPAGGPNAASSTVAKRPTITMAKYHALNNGMTYITVIDIIGERGKILSRSGSKGIDRVTYGWANADGSSVHATFENGLLVSKVEFGLK